MLKMNQDFIRGTPQVAAIKNSLNKYTEFTIVSSKIQKCEWEYVFSNLAVWK